MSNKRRASNYFLVIYTALMMLAMIISYFLELDRDGFIISRLMGLIFGLIICTLYILYILKIKNKEPY